MFIRALEHSKYNELTRAPCRSRSIFDVFDHFFVMKFVEIFRGAPPWPPIFGLVPP